MITKTKNLECKHYFNQIEKIIKDEDHPLYEYVMFAIDCELEEETLYQGFVMVAGNEIALDFYDDLDE